MTDLFAQYHAWEPRVTDEEIAAFLRADLGRVGSDSMITPREIIRDYMTILNILLQNPDITFADIIAKRKQQEGTAPTASGSSVIKMISATDIEF